MISMKIGELSSDKTETELIDITVKIASEQINDDEGDISQNEIALLPIINESKPKKQHPNLKKDSDKPDDIIEESTKETVNETQEIKIKSTKKYFQTKFQSHQEEIQSNQKKNTEIYNQKYYPIGNQDISYIHSQKPLQLDIYDTNYSSRSKKSNADADFQTHQENVR